MPFRTACIVCWRWLAALPAILFLAAAIPAHAQWPVGALTFNIEDLPGELPIPVRVWYPATQRGVDDNGEPASRAVPPAPGRRRLIMLSHGSGGMPLNQRDLILHLVAAGAIVAAPLHSHDNIMDQSGAGTDLQLVGRPRHIARSIDAVLAHPTLGPLVDPARIGLIGYSAGGYTGLVVIGGQPDFALGPAHCAQARRDSMFCGWMRRGGILRRHPEWPIVHDDRVRAAVLLAPAYGIYFDRRGLANVKAAVRIYVAEADEVVHQSYNEDNVRRALPQPPEYVVVPRGHFVFVSPCRRPISGGLCNDAAGVDRVAIHRRMNGEIKDFFDRKLGKD